MTSTAEQPSATGPVGVVLIGAGVISDQYLRSLTAFPDIRVLGIADLDTARAEAQARAYGVDVAGDVETVLGLPEAEIAVNLTVPAAHAAVAGEALRAGKHVYGEKPLVLGRDEGARLLDEAARLGLRVGCAPDTFLGAGIQSALRAVDAGLIGSPIAASTATLSPGPESWHPSPEFLFQRGAGPLFDIGPYYLTALVSLFGPAGRVAATARRGRPERAIGSGPKAGTTFRAEVPTHVTTLIDFTAGESASSTFSFDSALPRTLIEITGTEGTLWVPDPNTFGGPLRIRGTGDDGWRDLPVEGTEAGRGIGLLEMCRALRAARAHRASGEMALHVLDIMTAVEMSAERGEFLDLDSTCTAPEPLPATWDPHTATL